MKILTLLALYWGPFLTFASSLSKTKITVLIPDYDPFVLRIMISFMTQSKLDMNPRLIHAQ